MFWLDFRVNFVDTRKNFPDAQKLSGRQCRRADGVFLPLQCPCWNAIKIRFSLPPATLDSWRKGCADVDHRPGTLDHSIQSPHQSDKACRMIFEEAHFKIVFRVQDTSWHIVKTRFPQIKISPRPSCTGCKRLLGQKHSLSLFDLAEDCDFISISNIWSERRIFWSVWWKRNFFQKSRLLDWKQITLWTDF